MPRPFAALGVSVQSGWLIEPAPPLILMIGSALVGSILTAQSNVTWRPSFVNRCASAPPALHLKLPARGSTPAAAVLLPSVMLLAVGLTYIGVAVRFT